MTQLSLLADVPAVTRADLAPPSPAFHRGDLVRAGDGRLGEVLVYCSATERACVRFHGPALPVFVHRLELARVDVVCAHRWDPTITVWEGEGIERLTETCTRCGVIRGRA